MAEGLLASALANHLGGQLEGPDRTIRAVAGLAQAGPDDCSFLANPRYKRPYLSTRAGLVLVPREAPPARPGGPSLVRLADPYLGFARAAALLHPRQRLPPEVHPSAVIHPSARVETCRIEAFVVISEGVQVGEGCHLEPGVWLGPGVRLGRDCHIGAHAAVLGGAILGDRVWLNPGAVVGAEGFGFAPGPDIPEKIPQLGSVEIGDDVELGANTTVDRGTLPGQATRVARGARLDNLVQIGHGAEVGEGSLLAAYSGLAGSARIGRGVQLGAKAAVMGHLEVGDEARVAAASLVTRNIAPATAVAGIPAIEHPRWLAQAAAAPELSARIQALEARIAQLEEHLLASSRRTDAP